MEHDDKNAGPVTLAVAKWAATVKYEDIPPKVIAYTKLLLLDGIGCTVFGSRREAGRALYKFVGSGAPEKPESTIWGYNKKVSARSAALVNGTSAHTTNIGDTHRATLLHTNYVTPQAAISVGEKERKSGKQVLTAIVAGNEIGTRAGLAVHIGREGGYFTPETRGWHATGTVGALASAVTSGRLLGLSTRKMIQAVVLGGTQLTGMYRPCGSYMGKHWYAGKAVANGVEGAYLARSGFVAGYRLFEDGLCFGSGTISPVHELKSAARGLGKDWETLNVDMAIYPAKKTYYPNLDAVLHILRTENLRFAQIDRIVIRSAFATSHAFGAFNRPRNATEAFNSLRHAIAAAAHDGEYGFAQLQRRKFADPKIVTFSRDKIEVVKDPELEALLPSKWPGAVEIYAKDGRHFVKRFDYHIGQIQNPIDRTTVFEKFLSMTKVLKEGHAKRIVDLVDGIEKLDDITKLTRLLAPT